VTTALERAQELADEVLFPAAMAVEAAPRVPVAQLDQLAAAGLYGLAGPASHGGLDLSPTDSCAVIETLAGGCLTTAFVWLQHHTAVRAVRATDNAGLRDRLLAPMCAGTRRAGLAVGGAMPGPPKLRAARVDGGYRFDGSAPWVTGWGLTGLIYTAARDDQDTVITALLPAAPGPTLSAEPLPMVAVAASATVQLDFTGHFVPSDQVTGTMPHQAWLDRDALGLRANGSLALGVISRCCRLIGPGPLDAQLDRARAALDTAGPEAMPAARAQAAELAIRAAAALVTTAGSGAILTGADPQRLAREALFLLVFASRPAIKQQLAGLLAQAAGTTATNQD
jgi:alkylation response protein AidB-like acyl-CoA dehydrogenase